MSLSGRYTTLRQRCLCAGHEPPAPAPSSRGPMDGSHRHRVLVAFLRLENDEYHAEASLRTYFCLPMNRITVWLTQRPWIHCQLVFWDCELHQYYTFSVDTARPVHVFDKKSFERGWDFLALYVTEQCELRIHNFLVQQLGKTMNSSGQLTALFCPLDSGGERWFCSELVAAALQAGGVIDFAAWESVDGPHGVVMHQLYDFLRYQCRTCIVRPLAGNPVAVERVYSHLSQHADTVALFDEDGEMLSLSEAVMRSRQKPPH